MPYGYAVFCNLSAGDPLPPLSAGVPRIYSMRFCPWAERVVLAAAAKQIPYALELLQVGAKVRYRAQVVNINLADKPEWYATKHPHSQVPAFEVEGKVKHALVTSLKSSF